MVVWQSVKNVNTNDVPRHFYGCHFALQYVFSRASCLSIVKSVDS